MARSPEEAHVKLSAPAALLAALPLCACAPALVTPASPKTVSGQPVAPYEWHEECLSLGAGDRIEFAFESTEPVDFNFHYHEGKIVVMPLVREKTRADSGVFVPPSAQEYCLMWEAGAAGASIDYRIRLKRAGT
jgi:hypothetical protein